MIFVRSQALDNSSADLCVLDDELVDAAAPEASTANAVLSETRLHGLISTHGSTEIANGAQGIAVKVATADFDRAGRNAPVVAVFDRAQLPDIDAVVDTIARYTQMLGRHIDRDALLEDLLKWHSSGKARGGRLSRLRRQISLIMRNTWRDLRGRLSKRRGAR